MTCLTEELAGAAVAPGQWSGVVVERAKRHLLDYLLVCLRGSTTASAGAARVAVEGSAGRAQVEGTDIYVRADDAALVNAISAHSLELDDLHEGSSSHPGTVIWPTVIALGEETFASCDRVLTAAVIGYGIMTRIGELLHPPSTYARGFHPTSVCGVFGAAAAAGHLLELNPNEMLSALGIAGTSACGSMEFLADGAWTKRLNPGLAAANGIRAARLARAGFSGPRTALEGRFGFFHSFGESLSGPPGAWRVEDGVLETSIKFYPCCRYMHGCLDLLTELVQELDLRPAEIDGVGCCVLSAGLDLVAEPITTKLAIRNVVDAQFSMPFGAAVALQYRDVRLSHFQCAPDLVPELRELMNRVECYSSANLEASYPQRWAAEVWLRMKDGLNHQRSTDAFRGSPRKPAGWPELHSKATDLMEPTFASQLVAEWK